MIMPLVQVYMAKGRTDDQKRALLEGITKVMNETVGAPVPSIRVWITEFDDTEFIAGGEILADRRATSRRAGGPAGSRRHIVTVAPARHFIGGEFRDSLSGQTFDVISPVTEQVVTTAARGDVDDVAAAVKAATDAFAAGDWSRAKPSFRRQVLMKAADLIDQRYPEINRLEALEMGHPIGAPVQGPSRSAWNLRFFAMEQELAGNHSFNRDDNLLTYTMCDPVGTFALHQSVERAVHAEHVEAGAGHRVRQLGGAQAQRAVTVVDRCAR